MSRSTGWVMLLMVLGLSACGFGGDVSRNPPPTGHGHGVESGSSDIYLPFYAKELRYDSTGAEYWLTSAFYAANPKALKASSTLIDSLDVSTQKITPRARLKTGAYSAAEFLVHNFRETGMLYTKGGRFYMAGFNSAEPPMPMPVSAETAADVICNDYVAYHYPEQHHTMYLYQKTVSGDCATGVKRWSAITMGDAKTVQPRLLPPGVTDIVTAIYAYGDASVEGFLVVSNNTLQYLSADFMMADAQTPTLKVINYSDGTPVEAITREPDRLRRTAQKKYWLQINGGFFQYDSTTNKLDAPAIHPDAFNVGADDWEWYADNDALLLHVWHLDTVGAVASTNIYRFPDTDTYAKNTITPLVTKNNAINDLWVLPDGILYLDWGSTGGKLVVKSWDAATPSVDFLVPTPNTTDYIYDVFVQENSVFIESVEDDRYHLVRKEIGSSLIADDYGVNSHAVAVVYGHVYDPVLNDNDLKSLVIQTWDAQGAILSSIDAKTGTTLHVLGRLDAGLEVTSVNYDVWARDDGLLSAGAYNIVTHTYDNQDVYYFDASIENSFSLVMRHDNNHYCRFPRAFPLMGMDDQRHCQ
ncbi:MAG: hypothetical protein AABY83_06210 [Pseudomonadota bacterium]